MAAGGDDGDATAGDDDGDATVLDGNQPSYGAPPLDSLDQRGGGGPPRGPSWGVRFGDATVTPGLDKSTVRTLVRRRRVALGACYEQALAAHPGLAGDVIVAFAIEADGTVTGATATGDPAVRDCFADAIRAAVFVRPDQGARVLVRHAFTLQPPPP